MNGNIVETKSMSYAYAMAQAVMKSDSARIGQVPGESGTGKTVCSKWLESKIPQSVRIVARPGSTRKSLVVSLARELGYEGPIRNYDSMMDTLLKMVDGVLILVDEANQLGWQAFESLRYLADEGRAGVILFGTEIMSRTFDDLRSGVYLKQMARRIGAKRVPFGPFSNTDLDEVAKYVITPAFGPVSKGTAKRFLDACGGYWGEATELAEGCKRIMENSNTVKLDENIVQAAAKDMSSVGWQRKR